MSVSLPVLAVARLGATDRLVGLTPFALSDAVTGDPPELSTSVRVGLRAGDLLVRFDGRDAGTVATMTRRDEPLWKEDVFEVFLSPLPEPTVYYEFEVNPLGTLFDARVTSPEGRRDTMSADVVWNCQGFGARVKVRPGRWSALLTIPLRPMDPEGNARLWRANFYRIDRGERDEYSAWHPTLQSPPDFHVPARFGWLRLDPAS
jgi:Carbohydrate-binding family 9